MAKTNEIIQAKGPSYMKDTVKKPRKSIKKSQKKIRKNFQAKKLLLKRLCVLKYRLLTLKEQSVSATVNSRATSQ
ncbi:hypothetical protein AB6G19_09335 [Providencia manganoxydans]